MSALLPPTPASKASWRADIFVVEKGTMMITNIHSGLLSLASIVLGNICICENAFGLLVQHPRLVGERDFNSLDKQTQALADMCSDSLSVASCSLGNTFTLFCILGCNHS